MSCFPWILTSLFEHFYPSKEKWNPSLFWGDGNIARYSVKISENFLKNFWGFFYYRVTETGGITQTWSSRFLRIVSKQNSSILNWFLTDLICISLRYPYWLILTLIKDRLDNRRFSFREVWGSKFDLRWFQTAIFAHIFLPVQFYQTFTNF